MIQEIGNIDFDDGMNYDFSKLTHETIAPDSEYPGIRLKFVGKLGKRMNFLYSRYQFAN
jgi:hypothetical protein